MNAPPPLPLSLSLSLVRCLSLPFSLFPFLSVCLSFCLYVSISVSVYINVCPSVCLYKCISMYLFFFIIIFFIPRFTYHPHLKPSFSLSLSSISSSSLILPLPSLTHLLISYLFHTFSRFFPHCTCLRSPLFHAFEIT